jgi:hypothetical protein
MFNEDKSNPVAVALLILWLPLFLILTPLSFISFVFWLSYWTFRLIKQKYYKDRRPLRIQYSFHYFLIPKLCQAVKKKTNTSIVHFPHGIEFVLTSEVVRVYSLTRHILELFIWIVVKRPYYFSLKSLDHILRVCRSGKSKTTKISSFTIRVFEAIGFVLIVGLPKSVLDISHRTSRCFQPSLIRMKKISHFTDYLKSDDYHCSIYAGLIQNDFFGNEERPLRGLRVPISPSHHLPPLDDGSRFNLNLYLFENLNKNFKFI